jgi:hypothetical protein
MEIVVSVVVNIRHWSLTIENTIDSARKRVCPRNAGVRVSHRYVFAHFVLIITLKWKVIES